MTKTYLFRVILLAVALVLVAASTLWAVEQTSNRFKSLEHRLTSGLLESFRLSDDFQVRLQKLNNTMLRFEAHHEPSALAQFRKASLALNDWIDQHDPLNKKSDL